MNVAAEQTVKERPPHPGPLVWVDATPEVRALAEQGMTVEGIARTTRLTRLQVTEVLDRYGYRRLHDAPKKTGRRTFDRAAARAAYDAGECE